METKEELRNIMRDVDKMTRDILYPISYNVSDEDIVTLLRRVSKFLGSIEDEYVHRDEVKSINTSEIDSIVSDLEDAVITIEDIKNTLSDLE